MTIVLTMIDCFSTYKKLRYWEKKLQKLVVIMTIYRDKHTPKSSKLISSCLRVCSQVRDKPSQQGWRVRVKSFYRNLYSWFSLYLSLGHLVAMRLKRIKIKKNSRKWSWFCPFQFAGHWWAVYETENLGWFEGQNWE